MSLVSVIVPVYNAERFLDICIQSVLEQTYSDWELLLVNDGSTDKSLSILNRYACLDNRIIVINKENSGVSDARNCALDLVKGDYIIFLDADDYWCINTALEILVNVAERYDLDIVRGEYINVDENNCKIDLNTRNKKQCKELYAYTLLDSYHLLKNVINNEFYLPLSLFNRNIINSIRFESGRLFVEDMVFYFRMCIQQLRCMYIPNHAFYAYRQNLQSISHIVNILKLRDYLHTGFVVKELSDTIKDNDLKSYYQVKSLTIYRSTLKWLTFDEYFANCNSFIYSNDLLLKHTELRDWIKINKISTHSLIFYLPIYCVIRLYRFRYILSKLKNRLRWSIRQ